MACPLCGDQCHCSADADAHTSVLIDPENLMDDSEAQFASSLEDAGVHDVLAEEEPLGDILGSGTPIVTPRLEVPETTLVEAATTEPPEFYRPSEPPVWRDEVSSKVDAYRAKRGRGGRRYDANASLSLNFETLEEPVAAPPVPARYAPVRLEMVAPETNVIEFPKPMPVQSVAAVGAVASVASDLPLADLTLPELPPADELAEPIADAPRILDVPEHAQAVPEQPLADIQLDEPEHEFSMADAIAAANAELPMPVAPTGPRIAAGMIDLLIVLTASAIFGMIFMMIAKELPDGRNFLAAAIVLPGILWGTYQYLFLVRCHATPGMQMAQVGLAHFDETKHVTRKQRQARALAMIVSAMSLGLGFAWAMLDQDRLTWHDRISHSFVANE
jgi:uncharacterized RDD family membrane protein YckC